MNEYPFGEEQNAGSDVEPETGNDDSPPDTMEALQDPADDDIRGYSPNQRAVRVRRAIESYYERAALKELIDDSFNQL